MLLPSAPAATPDTFIEDVGNANADGVVITGGDVLQSTPQRRKLSPSRKKKVDFVTAIQAGAGTHIYGRRRSG